jgi:hypothetical protein
MTRDSQRFSRWFHSEWRTTGPILWHAAVGGFMKVQTCGHTLPCPFPSPFQRRKKSGIISQFFFQLETGLQNRYGPVRSHHPPKKTPVWGCLICGNTPKTPLWGGLDQGRPSFAYVFKDWRSGLPNSFVEERSIRQFGFV